MVKFLHTSDWHLGIRRHFLNEEAQPRFMQDRLDAVRRIGDVVREEGCEFVVVAGDILDSNQVDPRTAARALEALRAIEVPVYLLPGNHDAADASSMLCGATFRNAPANVRVLFDPAEVVEVAPGVELVPAPLRTRQPLSDLAADAIQRLQPGPVRILLAHGPIDQLVPSHENPAVIRIARLEEAIHDGIIHYVALGDRHSITNVGTTGRVRYSGALEVTDYDEDAGKVLVVTLDRDSIDVQPRDVGAWSFRRMQVHLNGEEDVASLERQLESLPAKACTVLRLALVGTLGLQAHARFETMLERARSLFAAITISEGRSELAIIPDDTDFADVNLVGFAAEAVTELRVLADNGTSESATAQDALALMVRLAGRGA
jgi:DNA repair exonuclease SbcCD nuclease subunit